LYTAWDRLANICHLYDVGPNYLVTELVEGPTLAERIEQGPIPLEEALGIARQVAAALEAAHEKGITHRDLKPGNIKIRMDGVVKVLDFGLAKMGGTPAVPSEESPTLTMGQTEVGMILGTASYMSPEQAKGKPVGQRSVSTPSDWCSTKSSPESVCVGARRSRKLWPR
jgi:eukaryotic-like serine/threonine-protein kinase